MLQRLHHTVPPGSQDRTKLSLFSRHLTSWPCFLIQIRGGAGAQHHHTQGWSAAPGNTRSLAEHAKLNSSLKTGASAGLADSSVPLARWKSWGRQSEEQIFFITVTPSDHLGWGSETK